MCSYVLCENFANKTHRRNWHKLSPGKISMYEWSITISTRYRNLQIVHVTNISCDKLSCQIIIGQTTPYRTIVSNAHNFSMLNFRTGHALQYFNTENFLIYGVTLCCSYGLVTKLSKTFVFNYRVYYSLSS